MSKKVILAYSGGLDTSIILKYLVQEKNYEVIAYMADLGQVCDFDAAREKALKLGAAAVEIVDLREEFLLDYIYPLVRANMRYENRYLQGTSLARPSTAKGQVAIAKKYGANVLAHGATSKGNDQIRFEFVYRTFMPEAEIFAPWKDPEFLSFFDGRDDLLAYADKHQIPIKQTKDEPWSTDDNMLHISYEAGMLEDPLAVPRAEMFELTTSPQEAPDAETVIELGFKEGNPDYLKIVDQYELDNMGLIKEISYSETITEPLALFEKLNELACTNGVGRLDLVESRYIGIKSRGIYETPAGTIMLFAHQDLESLCLDREVIRRNQHTSIDLAERVYSGYWFSPERELMQMDIDNSQKTVNGFVRVSLYKGNLTNFGRFSPDSLYQEDVASMHEAGGYDQTLARGFIDINAMRLQNYQQKKQEKKDQK